MSRPSATRRWPDILIGVLVLLLLGGFAALLLGQQKPASTTVTSTTATPAPEVQAAPGSVPDSSASAAPQDSETTPITPPAEPSPSATVPDPATTDQGTTEAPIIPAAPTGQTTEPSAAADPQTTADPAAAPEGQTADNQTPIDQIPATTAPAEPPQTEITETPAEQPPVTATPAPRSGGAVATSDNRTPLRSDYRISLGTFGSVGTAQSRTAPVSSLGYTVYPIDLGSQVVAQVGPFADEASARQALGDIQRAFPGALLYPPRNQPSNTPSSSSDQASTAPAPASPAPSAPARNTAESAPAAASGPVYLQVGAFDRVESAQKMVQQLRDLGYVPTVNAPEGRKVTVAVGPYTGDALTRTEKRLDDNDLDHFRVR